MTPADLSRVWWPVASITPLDALREVLAALDEGRPASAAAAKHVSAAFRMYLQGNRDITRNLGLRTRRGGRHDTSEARERNGERNNLVRAGVLLADGLTTKERAAAFSRALEVPVGEIDGVQLRSIVERLRSEFDGQLPASARQICRIASDA